MTEAITVKRTVKIDGRPTSLTVEEPFWEQVREIARKRKVTIAELIQEVDQNRPEGAKNLSSAVRLYVLAEALRKAA